jgi:glutathione S-transferase
MTDFILHHYPTSPFSEKIRLIFGARKLAWRSVIIPRIMPKPDVIALTGGYRKTPILQIGADIYCDSALIAAKIDEASPGLYPAGHAANVFALSQWADSHLFTVVVRHVFQPGNLPHMFADNPGELEPFTKDRQAMRTNATTRRLTELEAFATAHTFLRNLDKQLATGIAFAAGDVLSVADFSVYHCLWFLRRAPEPAKLLDPYKHVTAWMRRIAEFGHGNRTDLSSAEAVAIAKGSSPKVIDNPTDAASIKVGTAVQVLPTDYGIDPTPGTLVTCTDAEIVIRRIDSRADEVFVHFPRLNYEVRKADA